MGHNFYGAMILDLCWYFTVREYSTVESHSLVAFNIM